MNSKKKAFETYNRFTKTNPIFQLIPMESVPSLPIPVIQNGQILLCVLFYTAQKVSKNEKMKIFRPNAKAIIEVNSSKIVWFQNYAIFDEFPDCKWETPIGEFPHDEIATMTLKQYNKAKEHVISEYDKFFEVSLQDKNNDIFKNDLKTAFNYLCEPCLLPFMQVIGSYFFDWIDQKSPNV